MSKYCAKMMNSHICKFAPGLKIEGAKKKMKKDQKSNLFCR